MKKNVLEFIRRGLLACGLGPLILVIVYLIARQNTGIETLTVIEVCTGILSLSALAFIAGGMNVVYQIERLPLMAAVFIHGIVLYAAYLAAYLVNGWLERGMTPLLVFTAIFVLGYLAVWAVIYTMNRRNTKKVNQMLQEKLQKK